MRRRRQESAESDPRPKRRSKALRVGRTVTGRGVFAGRRYRENDLIGEIQGEAIRDEDYTSAYCYDMGDSWCLEPAGTFRFLNHSCQPNCRFNHFSFSDTGSAGSVRRVFVFALRDIAIDEQLTIDYRWPPAMAIPCRCGSPECRTWIVAAEDRDLIPAAGAGAA